MASQTRTIALPKSRKLTQVLLYFVFSFVLIYSLANSEREASVGCKVHKSKALQCNVFSPSAHFAASYLSRSARLSPVALQGPTDATKSPKTPLPVSQRSNTIKATGSPRTPKVARSRTTIQRSIPRWNSSTRIVSRNSPTTSTSSCESALSCSKATKCSPASTSKVSPPPCSLPTASIKHSPASASKGSPPTHSLPTVSSKNKENKYRVNKSVTKNVRPAPLRERQLVQIPNKNKTPKQATWATSTKLDLETIKKFLSCA